MWSMKKLHIELFPPVEEDWTFWGWITYWYNLERCNSRQGTYLNISAKGCSQNMFTKYVDNTR